MTWRIATGEGVPWTPCALAPPPARRGNDHGSSWCDAHRQPDRRSSTGPELDRPGSGLAPHDPMLTILIVVLLVMAVGSAPAWPHSRSWGYYPSGGLGLVLLVVLLFVFLGPHSSW